jgi:hypothetical protein
MKIIALLCGAALVVAAVSGCGRNEESTPPAQPTPAARTEPAPTSAPGGVLSEAKTALESAPKAVEAAVDQAVTQAQGLIDQTKALLSEKKYQDALGGVQKLASLKLSPEQQTLVGGLKTELTKMGGAIEKGIAGLKEVVAKKDYAGGMTLLKDLANYQLTPEQKKVVDGLKLELQKLTGSPAAEEGKKAVSGLLEPKP